MHVRRVVVRQLIGAFLPLAAWPPQASHAVTPDRCLQEVAIPGAYVSSCMRDSERSFDWASVGHVSIAQGEVGPGTTGAAVWTAGVSLASLLAREPELVKGKRILELGCGTGLCGIVAARLGAREVTLTDGNSDLLERVESNIAANLPNVPSSVDVRVRQLPWGEFVDSDLRGAYDVVLASDVLYQSSAWRPLAACIKELLRPKQGILLLTEAGHENTPAQASVLGFRAVAEGTGLSFGELVELSYGDTLLVRATAG